MQIQCKACGYQWADPQASRKLVLECPNCQAPNPVPGRAGDANQATVITSNSEATQLTGADEQTVLTGAGEGEDLDQMATQRMDGGFEPFKDSLVQQMMKDKAETGPKTRPAVPPGMAPMPPTGSRMAPIPKTNPPAAAGPRPLDETENTVPAAPPPSSRTPKLADETANTVLGAGPASGGPRGPRPTEDTEGATVMGTNPPPTRPRQAPTPTPGPSQQQHSGNTTATSKERNRKLDSLIGKQVGGYVFKKKLGQGGMGAVYLARQISLDRDVAVKVLPEDLAQNGDFLARFTREALTAAQLNHHNVVQVYDVGYDQGVHYICMEFVKGQSLGDVIRKDGKLPIDDAAGYLLQAARGLQFSHDRGIIHRDIKPDNIMVNDHGIVKIADMGLAKVAGHWERGVGMDHNGDDAPINPAMADLTQDDVAMGTPAYMAPEQGRDASKVDHRADQYSLGCTLYYMCAGKTPFSGKTTFEIISKHATEPLVPLEAHVKGVPRELSLIIEKMLAKSPEDRFPSMKEVIGALETYLDVDSGKGPYSPREQHVSLLERELAAYYGVGAIKTRFAAKAGFFAACLLLLTVFALLKQAFLASAILGLMVMTPLFQFILEGIQNKTFLFRRTRAVFFGMTLKGWIATAAWTAVALAVMYLFGLIVPWIVVAALAAGAAAAYQFVVLKKLREERATQLYNVQEMLKGLRLRGVSEDAIQDFVCRFSGVQWEEFFEDLFGYEAMIVYRGRYAKKDAAHPRKKHATWREPIVRWLEEIEDARRKEKEKRELARAEKARLKSTGVDDATAAKQAEQIATKAVDQGELMPTVIVAAAPSKKEIERLDKELHSSSKKSRGALSLGNAFNFLRWARLVLGLMMVLAFATRFPAVKAKIPGFIFSAFEKAFLNHGLLGANVGNVDIYLLIAAVAGLLLALSALSRQLIFPLVMLAGGAISSYFLPILKLSGAGISAPIAFWSGLAMVAAGFFFTVASRNK